MRTLLSTISLALVFFAAGTASAEEEPMQKVDVKGIGHPAMRSYRSVAAGLDAFDEYHALAPHADLRFRMVPRADLPPGSTVGLALRIASDDASIPVEIGPDGVFAVPRSKAAYDSNADLVLNRKDGMFFGQPEIRSPGLPENVRRLGDLRLECRVLVAIVKAELSFLARAAINTFMMTADWCGNKGATFGFTSPKPLAGATLTFGDRKLALKTRGRDFEPPIGDASWPDDSLVELR